MENFWGAFGGIGGQRGAEGRSRNRAAKLGTAPRSPYLYPLAKFGRSASKNGKSRKCFPKTRAKMAPKWAKMAKNGQTWPNCSQTSQSGEAADLASSGARAAAKFPNDCAESRSTEGSISKNRVENRVKWTIRRKWPVWRSENDLLQPRVGSAEASRSQLSAKPRYSLSRAREVSAPRLPQTSQNTHFFPVEKTSF